MPRATEEREVLLGLPAPARATEEPLVLQVLVRVYLVLVVMLRRA
jgi:hypothetical protein